jgi:hypothetical protein
MSSIDLCAQRTELPDALLASPFSSLVREIVSILLTQFILQYLPGRADWNLIDEQDAVGHLPLRNSVLQEIPNRVGGDIGLLGAHHEQERATIHFNFEGRRNVSGSVSVDRQSLQVDFGLQGNPHVIVTLPGSTWLNLLARSTTIEAEIEAGHLRFDEAKAVYRVFSKIPTGRFSERLGPIAIFRAIRLSFLVLIRCVFRPTTG